MKYLAIAFAVVGCMTSISYCTIQDDKNRHELVMWCLQNGGKIGWSGKCEISPPVTRPGGH